jgi:LuxR family maltose regulon positive regulatory protein
VASSPPVRLLVPTKLSPPAAQPTWVRRERLLARLGPGPVLTNVVAPAGFGKSTLVAQWLDSRQPPQAAAWLTLDEFDQDGHRFLAYVAGAIERVAPGATAGTTALLTAREQPPLYVVVQALLVDLSALPGGLTLVLDDYHAIAAEPVHQAVAYLLRNWPPACRLVIVSRIDPPLPLARLRAARRLVELRAADLRFSEDEAASLFAGLLGRAPDAALVAALHEETEGWAIALQLGALASQQAAAPSLPGAASKEIAEYLADEVFDQQPAPVQRALLALAVPERVCAGLAAALLDPPGDLLRAEEALEQLVRANLFLLPLDAERRWYRFHHLFRNLLFRRLAVSAGQEGMRALQLRAARWLADNGLAEEALRTFLAAGAEDAAAELVEGLLHANLGRDVSTARPEYWLSLLPTDLVARRPGLGLIAARLASFNTDVPALEAALARVDALLAAPGAEPRQPPWPTFEGDRATLAGSLRYWQGRPCEAIAELETALALGPVPSLASQALHILGKALVADGRYDEGVGLIEAGRAGASAPGVDDAARYLSLCGMHATAGAVGRLAGDAERLAAAVAARKLGGFWVCYAEAYRGRAAYERSDLAAAAGHFAAVAQRRYQINAPIYIGCLTGLAQIAILCGDLDGAAQYEREAHTFAGEVGGAFLLHQALACAVRLALARGDLEAARAHAEGIGADIHQGINTWFEVEPPRLSRARALILGGGAGLARAEALVAAVVSEAEPLHNVRPLVCALAVRAGLRQAQGRPAEARADLERAVALAAPRGFVRALADRGPALEPLLREVARRGGDREYLGAVVAALGQASPGAAPPAVAPPTALVPELLTPREMEVLALLAERWSDKEIAARLVIAPHTVRKHTSSIFGKLGVSSRREAVTAGRALGLLPGA